jgi:hypothetical protein
MIPARFGVNKEYNPINPSRNAYNINGFKDRFNRAERKLPRARPNMNSETTTAIASEVFPIIVERMRDQTIS